MTEQVLNHYDENEISLLDILVILAESWKLLLFGPLIAAVLSVAISFLQPKSFESVAIVRLSQEEVAMLHTARVIDPLVERLGYLQNANGIKDDALAALKRDLSFSVDKKNAKFSTVVAKGRTPESAQALCQAAIDSLLIGLLPIGSEKEAIIKELAVNKQLIADGVEFIKRGGGTKSDAKMEIANLRLVNLSLELKLEGKGKEVFLQAPSLPQRDISPKRELVGLLTALITAFALLLFVFGRKAWNTACQDEAASAKIKKIKLAFTSK